MCVVWWCCFCVCVVLCEDVDVRIDLCVLVEDCVKKVCEYVVVMECVCVEGDGGDWDDVMEVLMMDGMFVSEMVSDGATGATRKREVMVRILTRDWDYDLFDVDEKVVGYDVEDVVYKLLVSMWGVFEWLSDISKTYGGGRIVKREELEDEEVIVVWRVRVVKKLVKYCED